MNTYTIKKGTEVLAINYMDKNKQSITLKKMKRDVKYTHKNVQIDPVGNLGSHKRSLSLGGQFARDGFYGFDLPINKSNYKTMLVHKDDVILGA